MLIGLACVVRGQLDAVFSFKDEHKSEQDFKINITCTDTEMQFQWAIHNIIQQSGGEL